MQSRTLLILMALFCGVAFAGRNRPRCYSYRVPVGLLYSRGDKDVYATLKNSLENSTPANAKYTFHIEKVLYGGDDDVVDKVCDLYSHGVKAIVVTTPTWPRTVPYEQLSNLSGTYHIPLISYPLYDNSRRRLSQFIFTIKPNTTRASLDVIQYYGWKNVIILVEQRIETKAAIFAKEAESYLSSYGFNILATFSFHDTDDVVAPFLAMRDDYEEELHVILHATPQLSKEVVVAYTKQGFKKRIHFLLVEPFIADDWTNLYSQKHLKVTRFTLADPKDTKSLALGSVNPDETSEDGLLAAEAGEILGAAFHRLHHRDPDVFANDDKIHLRQCSDNPPVPLVHGLTMSIDIKRNIAVEGYSGRLQFDSHGRRTNYMVHVMETTSEGDWEIFRWSDRSGLKLQMLFPIQPVVGYTEPEKERYIITSILQPPYLIKLGNRYSGFVRDLINLVSSRLNLKYDLKLVDDGHYGSYNNHSGKWNGMIGEIIAGKADMAVAPLMVTSRRSLAVAFTVPFQSEGITLLMKNVKIPSLHHLMFYPFTWQLWLFVLFVYVIFGVLTTLIHCYTNSSKYRNERDKSSWPTRSWPFRILLLVLLVFTVMTISIYIASLGTMLSHQQASWPTTKRLNFKEVFRQSVLTGTPKVLLRRGIISTFLQRSRNPLYRKYWNQVSEDDSHFVATYQEGIQRILESKGDTALLINAASGEYLSDENCDLQITTGTVNVKSYSIALRLNHPLRESLNEAILSLSENGTLDYLYDRWWESKCPNGHKAENNIESIIKPVQLKDVDGLFYLLALGFGLIVFTTMMHLFCWRWRISSQSESCTILCHEQSNEALLKDPSLLSCTKRNDVNKS